MLCKKEAKNNSKQNKVRRNKFLKDSQYSEHDLENSFDENQDNKRDNLD